MFKKLKIRTRFSVIVLLVFLISLPIITTISYYILKNNAVEDILRQANIIVSVTEAVRGYVVRHTTPVFEREVPGKFIVEGMADSFVNNEIITEIRKQHKEYSYKNATLNPLNMANQADNFETGIIKSFQDGTFKKEWRGFVEKPEGKFYSVIKPISVRDITCLSCHGDPDLAPDEVTEAYGKSHGYGWKVGEIVAVDAVYVPADVPLKNARKALLVFASIFSAFFVALLLVINYLITGSIIQPIERFVKAADEISKGKLDQEFHVKTDDEIKMLANAFTRMKASIIKSMKIIRQIRKKG